jgi:hypothetical protein
MEEVDCDDFGVEGGVIPLGAFSLLRDADVCDVVYDCEAFQEGKLRLGVGAPQDVPLFRLRVHGHQGRSLTV